MQQGSFNLRADFTHKQFLSSVSQGRSEFPKSRISFQFVAFEATGIFGQR